LAQRRDCREGRTVQDTWGKGRNAKRNRKKKGWVWGKWNELVEETFLRVQQIIAGGRGNEPGNSLKKRYSQSNPGRRRLIIRTLVKKNMDDRGLDIPATSRSGF